MLNALRAENIGAAFHYVPLHDSPYARQRFGAIPGTLPVTQAVTERNLGVPRSYASFAVPLGATTKMDGCAAIYPAIAAIFVARDAENFSVVQGMVAVALVAAVVLVIALTRRK